MANEFLYGSICLSNIPKRLIKRVKCKDGQERAYLDIKIVKRREPSKYGHTHFISCEPRDANDRVEGEVYIIGDIKEYNAPSQQQLFPSSQPPVTPAQPTQQTQQSDDLPF